MSDPPIVCVVGPTASGKSALAEALAENWPLELISMDSAQIYRGMDIGTAKPDAQTRARVRYHLIDILDPARRYSAAQFATDARRAIIEVTARGRVPVIVGGTFLYLRALLQGLHEMPAADAALRREIERAAAARGWPALHADLQALDPAAAARIHPNDAQRIQRALEVAQLSGRSRSENWQGARGPLWRGPVLKLAILPTDREALRARIARRFEAMMQAGFLDEVRSLYARPDLNADLPSMRSVGYRQLWQHLVGECDLSLAVHRGVIASRQYAKRQMTWLRREPDLCVLPDTAQRQLPQAQAWLQDFLGQHGA